MVHISDRKGASALTIEPNAGYSGSEVTLYDQKYQHQTLDDSE